MSNQETILRQEIIPQSFVDSYAALELSQDTLDEVGDAVAGRHRQFVEYRERTMWEREKADAFESYYMMEKMKDLPYPGYPNLSSILPRIGVDSFHANVMQSIFGNGFRDIVMPRYMNPQFMSEAKKAAQYLSFQLEQECDFYNVLDDADRKANIYGIAYLEPFYIKEYVYETYKLKTTKEVISPPDPQTQQVQKKTVTTEEKKKRKKKIFDGIKIDSLPVESIFISPFVRDIEHGVKNDQVDKEFRLTWEQINFRTRPDDDTKKSFYIKSQVERLKLYCTESYSKDWSELDQKRVQYDGAFLDQLMAPKSVDLVEAHRMYDIDGDGVPEKVIVTFEPKSCIVVRVALGPCRIVDVRPRPVDERFYGEGIPKISKYFDVEWEAIHNARVAAGQWENMPFGFYRAGGRLNPTEVTFAPGHFYPTDTPQDVNFAPTPPVRPSFFQEENLLFNYFERVFGISENLQGIGGSREQTATENMQVANKAMVRFSNPFTRIVMAIEKLLAHMWDLNRACAPDEKEFYITGISPTPMFSKMSKKDYSAQLDFKLNVTTIFDQQLTQQTAMMVYNLMLGNPIVQQHPAALYDVTMNLLDAVNYKLNLPAPPQSKVLNPLEEHEMFLEGLTPEPQIGEDTTEHLQYHMKMLTSDEIAEWSPEAIKALIVHIDKTKILQATLQKFQLNQSGQFVGMPKPVAPGGQPVNMNTSRNPNTMMNNTRVAQTPGSAVNNAQTTPGIAPTTN